LTVQIDFNIIWEVTLEQEADMAEATITLENIYEALKTVYDPEIPVNIVDLGLVYDVQLKDTGDVYVQMTLTFPGCGMGPYIGQQAEWAVQELDGVEEVEIEMVFDPPWSPELISEEARSQLGI
jgi:metal-sulfur cluster biosynthetic enzyme